MTVRNENALSALNYRPGVDRRGRPKTTEVLIGYFTTRAEKAALVLWARAEKLTLSALLRRTMSAAVRRAAARKS